MHLCRVEAPHNRTQNRLCVKSGEVYGGEFFLSCTLEDRNRKDCNFFLVISFLKLKVEWIFEAKSWPEYITSI